MHTLQFIQKNTHIAHHMNEWVLFRFLIGNYSIKLNTEWVYFYLLMMLLLFTFHSHLAKRHTCGWIFEHGFLRAIQRFICFKGVWLIFITMSKSKTIKKCLRCSLTHISNMCVVFFFFFNFVIYVWCVRIFSLFQPYAFFADFLLL